MIHDLSVKETLLRRPYQVCLIIIVVLTLYYPAIFAEISILDDREAIMSLFNIQTPDFKSLFFPHAQDGGYYRPLLGVSYLIDRFWWSLEPKVMHLENILMHLANSLLVFFAGWKLCCRVEQQNRLVPLAGALLFALHPINTESVNWISGRTDPMACMFVLLALFFVLKFREQRRVIYIVGTLVFTLLGMLAKETALGFFLGSVFILAAESDDCCTGESKKTCDFSIPLVFCYTAVAFLLALIFQNFYLVIISGILLLLHLSLANRKQGFHFNGPRGFGILAGLLIACLIVVFLFLVLRKAVFVSDTSKILMTLKALSVDINYTLKMFIGAAGFYVKKTLIPTPLNLAIREIDPLYELFGVICYMVCILFIYLRRTSTSLVLAGFMMLSPAFLLVLGTFAWTGYAERYCYIPSAFWILAGVSYVSNNSMQPAFRKYALILFAAVATYFALVSFQRNLLWQKNISIIKDTVEKSPNFKNARGLYMSALVENKDFAEVERQYLIAKSIKVIAYDVRYDLLYATVLSNMQRHLEVEKLYKEIEPEARLKGGAAELYEAMIAYYDSRIFALGEDAPDFFAFQMKKIAAMEKLYNLNKSPHAGYRLGQNYLSIGRRDKARDVIKSAIAGFKSDEPLKKNAESLLNKLEQSP